MTTPKPAPATPAGTMRDPQTLVLRRSGISVTYDADYRTADAVAAQKAAREASGYLPYLIQRICLFDGARWSVPQILDTLPGRDFNQLVAAVFADDEDQPGNG